MAEKYEKEESSCNFMSCVRFHINSVTLHLGWLKLQQQLHASVGGFQFNFVSEAVMIEDLDLLQNLVVPRNKVRRTKPCSILSCLML